uniref:Uncharacterized protein n=1 Tax=Arion vulgaris TaxID=1028688 RepID=A0A0B6ZFY3_9EUPU
MEFTLGGGFAMIVCLCLSAITSPVSAKCTGRWQTHACLGGNGKRSSEPSYLHKILSSNDRAHNRVLQNENSEPSEEDLNVSAIQFDVEDVKDAEGDDGNHRQLARITSEIQDFRRYLRALKIQQALREREIEMM